MDIMPFWSTERLKGMKRYGRIRKRKDTYSQVFSLMVNIHVNYCTKGPFFSHSYYLSFLLGKENDVSSIFQHYKSLGEEGGIWEQQQTTRRPTIGNCMEVVCSVMGGWWSILKLNYSTVFLSSNWVPQLYVNVYLHGLLSITFSRK